MDDSYSVNLPLVAHLAANLFERFDGHLRVAFILKKNCPTALRVVARHAIKNDNRARFTREHPRAQTAYIYLVARDLEYVGTRAAAHRRQDGQPIPLADGGRASGILFIYRKQQAALHLGQFWVPGLERGESRFDCCRFVNLKLNRLRAGYLARLPE